MIAAKLTVSDSLDIQNVVDDWYKSLIIIVFCSVSTVFQLNEVVVSGFITLKYWYYHRYKCVCLIVFEGPFGGMIENKIDKQLADMKVY